MGANKEIFRQDREIETFNSENQNLTATDIFLATGEKINPFHTLDENFLNGAESFENGDISAIDVAVDFKKEIERLETQINLRKTWIDENKDEVESEAEKYQNEYKGFKITKTSRENFSFKNIPQWNALETAKKEFESKSKLALQMVRKGGLNVDESGEEIPLPEVSVTSFIKFDKLKK